MRYPLLRPTELRTLALSAARAARYQTCFSFPSSHFDFAMKTAEDYLREAEAVNAARPWGFLNPRHAALAAIQAAISDAQRSHPRAKPKPPPEQPTLF